MKTTVHLSKAQARRITLAAQGFRAPRHDPPTMRTLTRAVQRTGVLQVDSVNVLQRAHYMPLFARMGGYDVSLLKRANEGSPRRLVEYWAHVQALMPVDLWPVMQHRMAEYRANAPKWWGFALEHPELVKAIHGAVVERGAVTARDLETEFSTGPRSKEHWGWNWSATRKVLDYLYMVGDLAMAGRTTQFEPVYDIPERVLPAHVLSMPTLTPAEAALELVRRAARSHGIASANCLADYYRMRLQPKAGMAATKTAIDELVAAGELIPASVEGWKRPAYLHAQAAMPRRIEARTVLSPFDPVVWERARTEAIFDFFYRIEIYTPAHLRVHGYYVLPFLLGDQIVGRVDLKAERKTRRLLVHSAWAQANAPADTAFELAQALRELAEWLGLDDIEVAPEGDLGPALRAVIG